MDEPEIIYLADPLDATKPTALTPGVTVTNGSLRELVPDECPAYAEVGSMCGRPDLPDGPVLRAIRPFPADESLARLLCG